MVQSSADNLKEYVDNIRGCILDNDLIVIKDTKCQFAFASEQIVSTYGYQDLSDLEGKTVYDIRSCIVELADKLYHDRDKKIIQDRANLTVLANYHAAPLTGLIIQEGAPIVSKKNKLLGSIIKFYPIDKPMLSSSLILNLYQPSKLKHDCVMPKIDSTNNIQLSEREQAVLFLLSLNYDTRQIADIIAKTENKPITPNLIRNNINQQLYIKFDVNNVPDLIEKYSLLRQDKLIPVAFNQQFAMVLNYEPSKK